MTEPVLDRATITEALRRLGERLAYRGVVADQASAYVAPGRDTDAAVVFDHPGLRVQAASAPHLLAMKVLAGRRRDADDIRLLAEHLRLATPEAVREVCQSVFPGRLPTRHRGHASVAAAVVGYLLLTNLANVRL